MDCWKLLPGELEIVLLLVDGENDSADDAIFGMYNLYGWYLINAFAKRFQTFDVDCIVNETFLKVWEKRDLFKPEKGSLRAWLYTIAFNSALDIERKKKRPSRPKAVEAERLLYEKQLQKALKTIHFTAMQRVILREDLEAWPRKGIPSKDLAELLCTSANSINSQRCKAYRKLKKYGVEHPLRVKVKPLKFQSMDPASIESLPNQDLRRWES